MFHNLSNEAYNGRNVFVKEREIVRYSWKLGIMLENLSSTPLYIDANESKQARHVGRRGMHEPFGVH
jgi:hypothetical protein